MRQIEGNQTSGLSSSLNRTTDPSAVGRRAMPLRPHDGRVIGEAFPSVLASAQEGDEAAFARLWRDVNPALLRYLTLGGEPGDDVASDTWATVVKGLRRFKGDETAWRAWVFTTARRRAIDAGRRRARTEELERPWRHWPVERVTADPAEFVIERSETDRALELVAQLPPLQAEVILLRVVAGLPVPEVARIVGRSPGAVRVAAHRGLRRLEQALTPDGPATEPVTASNPATL